MSNVERTIGGQRVVWDRKKAAINRQKHDVEFEDASLVFADVNRIELYYYEHSQDEDRWQVIGEVEDILFVVYTKRKDYTRIISAREATDTEKGWYYGNGDIYFT